ncbi:hypothetical protein MSG28_001910 [Choristoneura fumiferana]|uniref:Uncharacterized protein n=1 Tax=Choristoneura fumiferana TaxID=7141 RepID=A0ACC0JT09_CHOFU|nr:hypothetical protein MSG28_001910 [Choristoneura fumiferana]
MWNSDGPARIVSAGRNSSTVDVIDRKFSKKEKRKKERSHQCLYDARQDHDLSDVNLSRIWPAVLRQATYGTIKFGTYYSLKKALAQRRADGGAVEHLPTNTFCAAFAGGLSSAIANPTDVLKVRMQMGDEKRNLVRCFIDIYRIEGVRGLWRGVGPTSQRAAVIAAVELPVYDACKHRLKPALGDTPANHLASSLLASLGSAVASTPLDVIRTRMMNQRNVKDGVEPCEKIYKGTIDCFLRINMDMPDELWAKITTEWTPANLKSHELIAPLATCYTNISSTYHSGSGSGSGSDSVSGSDKTTSVTSLFVVDCPVVVFELALMGRWLLQTVRSEGPPALYKGFVPTWLRMGPWNIIFFLSYEQLKQLY